MDVLTYFNNRMGKYRFRSGSKTFLQWSLASHWLTGRPVAETASLCTTITHRSIQRCWAQWCIKGACRLNDAELPGKRRGQKALRACSPFHSACEIFVPWPLHPRSSVSALSETRRHPRVWTLSPLSFLTLTHAVVGAKSPALRNRKWEWNQHTQSRDT